ncbi:hypothetical protein EV363DRAFT_1336006, partial [Boletus edulis]
DSERRVASGAMMGSNAALDKRLGYVLASASRDKTVRFWDATTGNPVGQYLRHDKPAFDVSFSPYCEFAASVDGKKIYLWQVPWWE